MESQNGELIEEKESEGEKRERFRNLLCGNSNHTLSENNQLLSKKCFSSLNSSKKRIHKHSIQIEYKDEEIHCIPCSPSSPFLEYSSLSSVRKPITRRSESCENCFSFDNQYPEDVDIDMLGMLPTMISTRKFQRSSSETTLSFISESQLPYSDLEYFSGDSPTISTI